MGKPFKVKTNRTCDFDIPLTWGSRSCGRPARWKWHADNDEFFCDIHKDGVLEEYRNEHHYNLFWSYV